MTISKTCNHPSFSGKFINNQAFKDVVKYAKETNQLQALDNALNRINNANKGDILIIHGRTPAGIYSNFNMNKRAVQNLGAETPEKASFNGILDLAQLGKMFKKLVGGDVVENINVNDIFKKYTV